MERKNNRRGSNRKDAGGHKVGLRAAGVTPKVRKPKIKPPRPLPAPLKSFLRNNWREILTGTVLAVDPASGASSMPGWAYSTSGTLRASGEMNVPKGAVPFRLHHIAMNFREAVPTLDILVIEKIRGPMVQGLLQWSVGAIASAFPSAKLVELPIYLWHELRDNNYVKSDAADAELILKTILLLAKKESEK